MVKRTRNKAITLRMTPDEWELFQCQFQNSGAKNQTDFVLRLLDQKPVSVDYELLAVLAELKRHGNNLNQLARQLNKGSPFSDSEGTKKVLNERWSTYRTLSKSRKGG